MTASSDPKAPLEKPKDVTPDQNTEDPAKSGDMKPIKAKPAPPSKASDATSSVPPKVTSPKDIGAKNTGVKKPRAKNTGAKNSSLKNSGPKKPGSETSDQPNSGSKNQPPKKPTAKKESPKKPVTKPAASSGPVARSAQLKKRHYGLALSFFLMVVVPISVSAYYLYNYARDQFVSEVGFTVRREDAPLVAGMLSTLGQISSASSTDSDILFEYVRSTELVSRADERLDLRTLYSKPYDIDPVFSLKPDASIEDLLAFWTRMVRVSYAPSTGLLELEVRAFTPQDARQIAEVIFAESTQMINELSGIAREDATRYALQDLSAAEDDLQQVRQMVTDFRLRTQIVDPQAAIQGQMGLLNSLQQQLGAALIEFDLLEDTTRDNDPRVVQIVARIAAIEDRIAQERQKFGQGGDAIDGQDYATVIAEFERLAVEREFAEQTYATALANLNVAQAEALRQSRYLAAYVGPTLPESAQHPRRILLLGLVALFSLLGWSTLSLIYYSLRDRR